MTADPDYPARLVALAEEDPHGPAFHHRHGRGWATTTWSEYASAVAALARHLGAGDAGPVALALGNRPEWPITQLAALRSGRDVVACYRTAGPEDTLAVAIDAGATTLVTDRPELAVAGGKIGRVIELSEGRRPTVDGAEDWRALATTTAGSEPARPGAARDGAAMWLPTLGLDGTSRPCATGLPTIASMVRAWRSLVDARPGDRHLSIFPVAHVIEQIAAVFLPLEDGAPVHFPGRAGVTLADGRDVEPTVVWGPPDHWSQLAARHHQALGSAPWLGRRAYVRPGARSRSWARRGARRQLGLRRTRLAVAVGGPWPAPGLALAAEIGLVASELFHTTEHGPLALTSRTDTDRPSAIAEGVDLDVRDGRLVVKVARPPEAGADGWEPTGDAARIDGGRIDLVTCTATEAEARLALLDLVRRAVVSCTEPRRVVLELDGRSASRAALANDDDATAALRQEVVAVVRAAGGGEVDELTVLASPLSIASGVLTPMGSVRRTRLLASTGPTASEERG